MTAIDEQVLVTADLLREDDSYHPAMVLYRWLLDRGQSAAAEFGLGQCLGKIYDYPAAAEHLAVAFALDADRSEGASYYAYILERLGRLDEAAGWYDRALAGDDADDLWARSHHAWFLEKWGKDDEACAAYDDVLERNPAYTWAVKRYALLLRRLDRRDEADALLVGAATSPFGRLNLLEYRLVDEDGPGYEAVRATLEGSGGPPWFPVIVELFDLCRDSLVPNRPDPERLAAWEASAAALTDSVHRDFDDLTALVERRGGDLPTWKRLIQLLLK